MIKNWRNGFTIGFQRLQWRAYVRRSLAADGIKINLCGLIVFVPNEIFEKRSRP